MYALAIMKPIRKIAVISALSLAIAGSSVAAPHLTDVSVKHAVAPITADTTLTPPVVKQTTQTTQTSAPTPQPLTPQPPTSPSPSVAAPAAPVISQPAYGEDPSNPGVYIVFDHTGIMNAAGVPADQQAAADTLITHLMNWRYKVDGIDSDLCYIMPLSKMATAGNDYVSNPVTQLTYCNHVAQTRFGGWAQALAAYNQHPTYGIFD